jgi:hypothetical protein
VFLRMAGIYAAFNRFCEATFPINMWVSPATPSQTQKIISYYETHGNCPALKEFQKESYLLRGRGERGHGRSGNQRRARTVHSRHSASYMTLKSTFADRVKIPQSGYRRVHADDGQRTGEGQAIES